MMSKVITREDLVDLLTDESGFFRYNTDHFLSSVETVLMNLLQSATVDEDVEIKLIPGLIIGGRRVPEHESIDPRTREAIITPEKVIPYATFKPSLRQKLYVRKSKKKKSKKG